MVLSMTRPQRRKDGTYYARKGVPADLRTVVGKRELIESLRTKDAKEALCLFPEVIAKFDATLAAARAQLSGQAPRPTSASRTLEWPPLTLGDTR